MHRLTPGSVPAPPSRRGQTLRLCPCASYRRGQTLRPLFAVAAAYRRGQTLRLRSRRGQTRSRRDRSRRGQTLRLRLRRGQTPFSH